MQDQTRRAPDDAEDFAFVHLVGLAQLLHASGCRDMAVLLDAMSDLHELSRRRAAKGQSGALLTHPGEAAGYALDQLDDLARLMDERGLPDAAVLMRFPAQLQAAARRRAEIEMAASMRDPAGDDGFTPTRNVG